MKQLLVLSIPPHDKLSAMVGRDIVNLFEKYDHDIVVRDLYKIDFKPVASFNEKAEGEDDIAAEQAYVRNSDTIILFYPFCYTGLPAMIKGYMERVFSEGFAYSFTRYGRIRELLSGKKIIIVNAFNKATHSFSKNEFYYYLASSLKNIFESFGMEVIMHYYFEVDYKSASDDNALRYALESMREEMKKSYLVKRNARLNIPNIYF